MDSDFLKVAPKLEGHVSVRSVDFKLAPQNHPEVYLPTRTDCESHTPENRGIPRRKIKVSQASNSLCEFLMTKAEIQKLKMKLKTCHHYRCITMSFGSLIPTRLHSINTDATLPAPLTNHKHHVKLHYLGKCFTKLILLRIQLH